MNELKPGTRCVVVLSECMPDEAKLLVGKRCTVIGMERSILALLNVVLTGHLTYFVDMDDGTQHTMCRHMLQPIDDRGDWKEIERATGYKPPTEVPA